MFVVALDTGGQARWSRDVPDTACGYGACPVAVAVEPSGRVVLAGSRQPAQADPPESPSVFQIILDSEGNVVVEHEMGGLFVRGLAGQGRAVGFWQEP